MIKYKRIFFEISIGIIITFLVLLTPFFLSFPNKYFTLNDEGLANIGTALSITSPFIGIISGILVYIAFRVQYQANKDINEKFEMQNADQLFFRIIDDLQNKKSSFKTTFNHETHTADNAVYHIIKDINRNISNFNSIAVWAIKNKRDELTHEFLSNLDEFSYLENKYYDIDYLEKRHDDLTNNDFPIYDESYETMMGDITRVYFYKVPYEIRKRNYSSVFKQIYNQHGGTIEGYFRTLKYLINFIDKQTNDNQQLHYIDYLTNNISEFEKALIFYYCASEYKTEDFLLLIKKHKIVSDYKNYYLSLYNMNFHKIEVAERELQNVLEINL